MLSSFLRYVRSLFRQPEYFAIVMCAWCQTKQGTRPCCKAQNGSITHGLCPSCARNYFPDMADAINSQAEQIIANQ